MSGSEQGVSQCMIVDEFGFSEASVNTDASISNNLKSIKDHCSDIGKLLGLKFENFRLETNKTKQGVKVLNDGSILYISTKTA
jgi:hypothetical protein